MSAIAYSVLAYRAFIIGGCAYLLFWRDAGAWWFLLAAFPLPMGGDDE